MEERKGLDNAAPGVHQHAPLIGEIDVGIERVTFYEPNDLISKVVDVDDDGAEAIADQVLDVVLQERLSGYFHKCLGTVLG